MMNVTEHTPRTANEHLEKQLARTKASLEKLQAKLEIYEAMRSTTVKDWGYGGDLERISSRLEELTA